MGKYNKISCIYTITNLINSKIYVGYSVDFRQRRASHISDWQLNKHGNIHLQNAINFYGKENFILEILEECDKTLLTALEHYWCNMLNTHNKDFGYNIKPTNPNTPFHNPKSIIKNEDRDKNIDKVKRMSIIGKSAKGKKRPKELIDIIVETKRKNYNGLYMSKEGLERVAEQMRKRTVSQESRDKMKRAKSKPIEQYTKDGVFIRNWDCAADVNRELGISAGNISNVCVGRPPWKSAGGFIWKFKIIENETTH